MRSSNVVEAIIKWWNAQFSWTRYCNSLNGYVLSSHFYYPVELIVWSSQARSFLPFGFVEINSLQDHNADKHSKSMCDSYTAGITFFCGHLQTFRVWQPAGLTKEQVFLLRSSGGAVTAASLRQYYCMFFFMTLLFPLYLHSSLSLLCVPQLK